jgi:hypothetical protein
MHSTIIILITVVSIVLIIYIAHRHTTEGYDMTGMGGSQFWGWGRGYGYVPRDQTGVRPDAYQLTPGQRCRPGYSMKINPAHSGNMAECVVNDYNYQ